MSTQYTREYFIAKFEAIPEEKWLAGTFKDGDCCCALGHCGATEQGETPESRALGTIFWRGAKTSVVSINDGEWSRYLQPTPKQRVLAALRDLPETK